MMEKSEIRKVVNGNESQKGEEKLFYRRVDANREFLEKLFADPDQMERLRAELWPGKVTRYRKAREDGQIVYRYNDQDAGEVPVYRWDLDEFVSFCIFPIRSFVDVMHRDDEEDPTIDVLTRLYDSAMARIEEMAKVLNRDLGQVHVVATNYVGSRDFMTEEILGVEIAQKPKPESATA